MRDTNAINFGASTIAGTLTVNAGGASSQSGVISANTLTGSAGSTVSLGANNVITNLDAFTSNGGFTLNDTAGILNINGPVVDSGAAGTISIAATGAFTVAFGAGSIAGAHDVTLTQTGAGC